MLKSIASLQGVNILSKDAQKKVQGGMAESGGSCSVYLPSEPNYNITWGGASLVISGGTWTGYGVTSANAQSIANQYGSGAHWCCSSCSSASWYNPPA